MNEQEKPFDIVSIVFLVMISALSDIADLATDLIFPVPIIGQIIFIFNSFVISPIVWAIIQFWFIMKAGATKTSLIPVLGGLGNMANIPGSETITTIIAITLANNSVAAKITSLATVGTGAIAAKGVSVAAEAAEGAAAGETGAAKTAAGAGRGVVAEGEAAEGEATEKSGTGRTGKEISPEEFGEEPEPIEKLQKRLFEEAQSGGTDEKDEDDENVYENGNEIDLRNIK